MIHALARRLGLDISDENFAIRAERMRALVGAYPSMIAANVVLAPLVAWLMWDKIGHSVLLSWVALLYAFHSLEIHHWLRYPKTINSMRECQRWQRQFLLSDSLVGAAWGSAGVFMFAPGEPVYQAYLLCIMMGLAAGAVAGNLVFPLSQQSYVALVITPILANLFLQGKHEYYLLGAMVGVFLVFVMKVGRDQSKFFELSIRRGFENIELADQLKKQRDRNQCYLDTTLALMVELDRDGKIVMLNQAAQKLLGYSENELLGRNWFSTCLPQPEGMELAFPRFQRLVSGDATSSMKSENTVLSKNGTQHVIAWGNTCMNNSDGQIIRILSSGLDITERRKEAEHLYNTLQLLEAKEKAKTRFLAAAGHDLRQPVAAASLFVYALKLTSPTQRQSELIDQLSNSMTTFSDLLERLLDISKFDAGLIKPQLASLNLAELFSWLEQNFAQAALDKQLRFRFFFPVNKPLFVRTDIGLLKSVLMNLVSNAIKFTSRGGILVSARIHTGRVIVQVWDTGIGIAAANLSQIYDEFYQVSNPQRSREGGLGLGLSICQRAISLLGGEIACSSHLGCGSVFTVSLPPDAEHQISGALPAHCTPAEVESGHLVRGKTVVVLEDDELVAAGLVELMRELGAVVWHFNNAEEALLHHDIAHADYFVADYALGGQLNGLQFLKAVQQMQHKPLRAVVITGETSSQFIASIADSPWPVLHKPVNFAKLTSSLNPSADAQTAASGFHRHSN